MKKISILGCGWLGLPLAEKLISKGFHVNGSTTSEAKIKQLETSKILPFQLCLTSNGIEGNINDFLKDTEVLIIDVPPKLRTENADSFVMKMQHLIRSVEISQVKKILFVSSTSVYGEENGWVTEDTIPNPETESGKQLWETEKLLQNNANFQVTIVRFGGLIGADRHPVKHLAGKENVENPSMSVNLIHKEDGIEIISAIIEQEVWGETFNGVAPFHPSRALYYTQKANKLKLVPPQFSKNDASTGKVIASEKVEKKLKYSFKLSLY